MYFSDASRCAGFSDYRLIDRRLMREEAEKTLRALDIHIHRLSNPIRSLSGGQRQSVAIGRAIHWKARVLIMDEPTAALGVPEQRKVMELITNLKGSGVGIIFISHNLIDIFQVSDRIMVLRQRLKSGRSADLGNQPGRNRSPDGGRVDRQVVVASCQ